MRKQPRTIETECHCGICDALVESVEADMTTTPGRVRFRPCGHTGVQVFKPIGPFGVLGGGEQPVTSTTDAEASERGE